MIYNKYRSFNSLWYSKYPWIEYSKQKDRIYCYYCRHFAINVTPQDNKFLLNKAIVTGNELLIVQLNIKILPFTN